MSELQLEVGNRYVARDGEVVKIVNNDRHPAYPFDGDNGYSYIPNGRVFYNWISDSDLISEDPAQASVVELTDAEISNVISASRFRVHGSMLEFSRELIAAHIAKQEQKS